MQINRFHFWGNVLFFIGTFFGILLASATLWTNYETTTYFFTGETYEAFNGLHCPVLMSRSETGLITATFDNQSGQAIQPYYKVEVSGLQGQTFEDNLVVPPHQSKSIHWTVDADNIDLGSFIFNKLEIFPDPDHSTRQALCGTLVLNVFGLSGISIFWIILVGSLAGIVFGALLLQNGWSFQTPKDVNIKNAMQALAISTLMAVLFGLTGLLPLGIIAMVVSVLLLFILLRLTTM